ncbi:hypothetical protein [Ruegeria conchae]|uniref:hypothetical protein n=1 Tax=Ruegeria conchae TaxID=981384 RepID=UPI0029C739F7|nr:hypothetical protein [Ruegeria conchae]
MTFDGSAMSCCLLLVTGFCRVGRKYIYCTGDFYKAIPNCHAVRQKKPVIEKLGHFSRVEQCIAANLHEDSMKKINEIWAAIGVKRPVRTEKSASWA